MRRIVDLSGGHGGGPQVFRIRLDKGCLLIAHGQRGRERLEARREEDRGERLGA